MRLWTSMTITSFGAQITNLALPLTAAVLLQATPMQMGVLVALETLPFALVSLHAGVLLDRVRKLPIVILSDVGRGLALLALPLAAFTDLLSIEILYVVGFLCGVQNVVGGAARRLPQQHRIFVQLLDGVREAVGPVARGDGAGGVEASGHTEHVGDLEHSQPGGRLQDGPRERLVQLVGELPRRLAAFQSGKLHHQAQFALVGFQVLVGF